MFVVKEIVSIGSGRILEKEEIKDIRSRQICSQHSHSLFTDFIFGFFSFLFLLFNFIQAALIILFQKHPIKKIKNQIIFVSDLTYFSNILTDTGFNVDCCRMISCYQGKKAAYGRLKRRR